MEISNIKTKEINQNGYHKNILTRDKIGFIFTAPVNVIPDDCLPCDGFVLQIEDYLKLYKVIGKTYNNGEELENEFRIPDYNITGRFLQAGLNAGTQIAAGLPNITGTGSYDDNNGTWSGACVKGSAGNYIGDGSATGYLLKIDASKCNSIYGKTSTVQPPSQIVRLCIKYK